MATMLLQQDVSIERVAYVNLIQRAFARSPLFCDATISEPLLTRGGEVSIGVSFGDGPVVFRVVAGSDDEAYAILNELADAMVEIDHMHTALA